MDPELEAMATISSALENLEQAEVGRVLRWALDRFEIQSEVTTPHLEANDVGITPESEGKSSSGFEHLADLMDAAQARTGVEKALIAGYWFQIVLGQPDFTGYQVNSELKNLGHGLANVTAALDKHIRRKPALVLQLAKGKSKMSHKKYKLTLAGVRRVEELIGGTD